MAPLPGSMVRFPKTPEELPGNFGQGEPNLMSVPIPSPQRFQSGATWNASILKGIIFHWPSTSVRVERVGRRASAALQLQFYSGHHFGAQIFSFWVQDYPWNKLSLQRAPTASTLHPEGGEQSINSTGQRDKQHLREKRRGKKITVMLPRVQISPFKSENQGEKLRKKHKGKRK